MLRPEVPRHRGGVVGFVELRVVESDRERADRRALCSCISATTSDESMPPDRNAPSGTSAIMRWRTAVESRASSSASASASVRWLTLRARTCTGSQ